MQELLDERARAVLDGDRSAYLKAVDPVATDHRARQRQVFENLRKLPLRTWDYQVMEVREDSGRSVSASSEGSALVVAELSYQLEGHDQGVRVDTERMRLTAREGQWYLGAETAESARQLWEQGELGVAAGEYGLVLGVGHTRAELRRLAREADRAVPAVSRLWPRPWSRRVVVLAPRDLERTAELLAASPAQYRGIAAVTTSERNGRAPADRVVVNPEVYGTLGDDGRQVVMTHETAHVATREDTTDTTPMWLSEGLADWVGYGGSKDDVRQAAPELGRAVSDGKLPRRLPTDAEFAFDRPSHQLALSYEAGWLACLMIAEQWDAQRLVAFYQAAGRPGPGAVDQALREVLRVDEREFDARWREYVRTVLG